MSERDTRAFLQDMFEAIRRILTYTKELNYVGFQQDIKTQDAVLRNLEILGEAAKQIPTEVTDQYPNLPWREMAGTRDRLIHHYGEGIDFYDDITIIVLDPNKLQGDGGTFIHGG